MAKIEEERLTLIIDEGTTIVVGDVSYFGVVEVNPETADILIKTSKAKPWQTN